MVVHLRDGPLFPSGARLPPGMAQIIKIFLTSQTKHYNISQDMFTRHRHAQTGKMQRLPFTGCADLHIAFLKCFVLMLSINLICVGISLCK
jgi:hypothetical protein